MGHLLILIILCFLLEDFWMALGHFDSPFLYDSITYGWGTFASRKIWEFCSFACINFCEWAKNWKILSLYLISFYLWELFARKESISIIIAIFFHVVLNFFHVKVVPLKIMLMCISVNLSLLLLKLHHFIKDYRDNLKQIRHIWDSSFELFEVYIFVFTLHA